VSREIPEVQPTLEPSATSTESSSGRSVRSWIQAPRPWSRSAVAPLGSFDRARGPSWQGSRPSRCTLRRWSRSLAPAQQPRITGQRLRAQAASSHYSWPNPHSAHRPACRAAPPVRAGSHHPRPKAQVAPCFRSKLALICCSVPARRKTRLVVLFTPASLLGFCIWVIWVTALVVASSAWQDGAKRWLNTGRTQPDA